jgi:hypothetical protein
MAKTLSPKTRFAKAIATRRFAFEISMNNSRTNFWSLNQLA